MAENPFADLASRTLRETGKLASKLLKRELDPDRLLGFAMGGAIEFSASRYAIDAGDQWKPGKPLKLLFAGYSGTRNTGADVRVEEMVRQFRHVLGDDHIDLSILTIDPELSRGYFRTVKQLHLPQFFPPFLTKTIHEQHGVVACEGSMFKSKFANALSIMMVGALGTALAEQKLAIAYGGEAGGMDEGLEDLVRRYCQGGLMITRNVESGEVLGKLGIKTRIGTDTAWTFEPGPRDKARAALERAGWDGKTPILAVTPINPFWWPVKPDLMKGAAHAIAGMHGDAHYDSFYFHNDGSGVRRAQAKYIASLADGMKRYLAEKKAFPILVGMEQLDRRACEALRDELGFDVPLFVSDEYEMYEMVAILRECSMLVSSRYHAIVTSMPGLVASAGVTMDERIKNLMADRGQPELCLRVDEEDLGDKVYETIRLLDREQERIRDGIGKCVVTNLRRMGEMGGMLADYVREKHPEFPLRAEFGSHGDPWAHLPPMSNELHALIKKYGEERAS